MRLLIILLALLTLMASGQRSRNEMVRGLKSCNKDSICIASYYFGERRDKSVIKELLTGIEDRRISNDIRHKGMSVYYCRMQALRKISGLDFRVEQREAPDSTKINKYINWARENKLIDDNQRINTKGCH